MKALSIPLIAGLLLSTASLTALAETPVYQRIDFSTEVARETVNDQLNATLSVELSDKDASRLAHQLNLITSDALKKASAFPQVKTSSGNQHTWPLYGSTLTSSSKLEGWRGRAEIRLESNDFKAASELISKLQEKLQLNGVQFSVAAETRRKLEDSLTAEAIESFRRRAASVQKAWGAKGYKLVQMSLGTAGGGSPHQPVMMRAAKMMDESVAAPEFAGGETRLTVNVSGSIELQP
jgi:predicted secreted protein